MVLTVLGFFYGKKLWREQGTLLLWIGLMILVFIWQSIMGEGSYGRFMTVPTEVLQAWHGLRVGHFTGENFSELSTLLTCSMLHAGADHLFGNMLFLWIFAALAAELLGARWMLATFFVTAICGSACHVALNPMSDVPMLGASGAVMGFEGLYLAMAMRWHLPDPHVWPMSRSIPPSQLAVIGVIGLALDIMGLQQGGSGIAHGAHLGGFLGGIVMGGVVVRKPRLAGYRR